MTKGQLPLYQIAQAYPIEQKRQAQRLPFHENFVPRQPALAGSFSVSA